MIKGSTVASTMASAKRRMDIMLLKRRARRAYIKYCEICTDMGCGAFLAEYINPNAYDAKALYNHTMDALAAIDPTTSKARL